MLDKAQRDLLKEKLRGTIQKASSNVTTEVKAEQGDFKIVITPKEINNYYKAQKVASISTSDLDDDLRDYISQDAESVSTVLLAEFMDGFNTEIFEKSAAHATQDGKVYQRTTEKQLDAQKLPIHPRDGEAYKNITEKQMPEHDERFGSYDLTTEAQLRDNKTTFKGEQLVAGQRKDESRATITEGQLDSEEQQGSVDRGDIGAAFDGPQGQMITDKQIRELISHHGWEEPKTITEGKDQLAKQTGELARLSAESASKMMKEAVLALGKTVAGLGVTPEEVMTVLSSITSSKNKEATLTSLLSKKQDISDVKTAIKRRQYHGKIASTDTSPENIASAILRQMANIDGDPRHKAAALFVLAQKATVEKITKASEEALTIKEDETTVNPDDPMSVLASAFDEKPAYNLEGDANDGFYQYSGKTEQIDADPADKEVFSDKAFQYSKKIVAEAAKISTDNLVPVSIDVDEEKGSFDLVMKDASSVNPETLQARAERRKEMSKEAQMPAGGMAPAGGPDMTNPAPPAGAADMGGAGAPPVENLTQPPGLGAPGGDEAPSGEPKPPGSVCPACGSEDVDLDNGEMRCNSCGAEGSVSVKMEVTKWPGTMEETEAEGEGPEEGFELGEEGAGLAGPPETPEPTVPPNVPVAASVTIKPNTLEKLAAQKIKLGSVCPNCGGGNCDVLEGKGICYSCNTEYKVTLSTKKSAPYKLAARFEWIPGQTADNCDGCNRIKTAFTKALSEYGINFEKFHNQTLKDKGDLILKMNKAGVLNEVFSEFKSNLTLEKLAAGLPNRWEGYADLDKFPTASCIERLNRRFGENASAMSGPCQGKKLADCVCSQLKNMGIYSDGLAAKVAKIHTSDDPEEKFPSEECIGHLKNDGFRLKESGFICDCLKAAYASYEDLLIEAITNDGLEKTAQMGMARPMPAAKPMLAKPMTAKPMAAPAPIAKPMPEPAVEDEFGGEGMGGDITEEAPGDLDVVDESVGAEVPDVPISDDGLEPEGLGEMGGEGDIGGGDTVDITLTLDKGTAEDIYQAIDQAINQAGPGDMGAEISDGMGGEIHDETIEGPGDELAETPDIQEEESEIGAEPEVTGELPNAEDISTGGEFAKEGDDEKACAMPAKPCAAPMEMKESPVAQEQKCTCPCAEHNKPEHSEHSEHKEHSEPKKEKSEGEESEEGSEEKSESEEKEAAMDDLLMKMKKGTITKESAGLSNMIDTLIKQAQKDPEKFKYISETSKKTKVTPAQDSVDFKVKDGGKIGHEEAFDAKEPDVPRKKQLLGTEGDDMGVNDTGDMPSVPAGSPAMRGEEHYRPEKQTEVDGNQGNIATTAEAAPKYKVASDHRLFKGLKTKYAAGTKVVTLNDGTEYDVSVSTDKKAFILTAKSKKCDTCGKPKVPFPASWACKCKGGDGPDKGGKNKKDDKKSDKKEDKEVKKDKKDDKKFPFNKKEAQTKQVKHIETNENDPDITPIKADKPHSLAVDELAPSEGVSKPDVPKAPNQGRLNREEIVSNELKTPEIPAGGGMNPDYDQNEKNTPEKQEDVLGIQVPTVASAKIDIKKEATRIAGEMLRHGKITPDQLNDHINHLSQLPMPLLKQYEDDILKKADTQVAGLEKKASADSIETAFVIPVSTPTSGAKDSFVEQLQSLMTLNTRNDECEKIKQEKGNMDIFR